MAAMLAADGLGIEGSSPWVGLTRREGSTRGSRPRSVHPVGKSRSGWLRLTPSASVPSPGSHGVLGVSGSCRSRSAQRQREELDRLMLCACAVREVARGRWRDGVLLGFWGPRMAAVGPLGHSEAPVGVLGPLGRSVRPLGRFRGPVRPRNPPEAGSRSSAASSPITAKSSSPSSESDSNQGPGRLSRRDRRGPSGRGCPSRPRSGPSNSLPAGCDVASSRMVNPPGAWDTQAEHFDIDAIGAGRSSAFSPAPNWLV